MTSLFACPDWVERLKAGLPPIPHLLLDDTAADRAVAIFNKLRLPDVIGRPSLGEAGGTWFTDSVVRPIFGSLQPNGMRSIPGVFLEVPKKNSKTTNSAGLMLTAMLVNQRPKALFALLGPTQEVADIAYDAAAGMIEADLDLKKLFHTRDHLKQIIHRVSKAELRVTTFDPAVATGGKYAGWLLDEAHLLGIVVYAGRVIGQLRGARAAIPEQFGVIITTQSDHPPAGVFKTELEYARNVRDGKVEDPSVLPVLYEFPEAMQTAADKPWRDEANWPMVLPNLGRSINLAVLRQDYRTARDKGEEEERRWASQHLNIEIGMALHAARWTGVDHWAGAARAPATLEAMLARCEVATIGVDGGGLDDLLGLCVLGREKETKRWLAWFKAWADRGVLKLRQEIAPKLTEFEQNGDLVFVDIGAEEGLNADVDGVCDVVETVWKSGLLPEKYGIGLDPVGVSGNTDEIARRGIPPDCMAAVPQGFRLTGVIKGAARKLKDGTLIHFNQPLAGWCVSNAKAELKGSAVVITKQTAGTAKIDPLLAMFNAFDLMARNPEPSRKLLADGYFASLKERAA